jgi:glutamate racemase
MEETTQNNLPTAPGPIGVFDSGYGGLTILEAIRRRLPQYDYLYLGDNARTPYGPRSFHVVYEFTRQAVRHLFERGCHLVILACNTASAKALRSIQQNDLPQWEPSRRVLGIIRPTAEVIGSITTTGHIGVMATEGTIKSGSYGMEIRKLHPTLTVAGVACPLWVPLVEMGEAASDGADFFVKKYIDSLFGLDSLIDAVILGCTHYPLLLPKIRQYMRPGVRIVAQGDYVASSLQSYLLRHPEMDARCSKLGRTEYLTTEDSTKFADQACLFLNGETVSAQHVTLA